MKHSRNEWLSALASGFLTGVVVVVLMCIAIKLYRESGHVGFGFKSAAEALLGMAVTL